MDLKQIKTFICVAESGSLSRASDRLHTVQPALSRQIKLLEHEIGVELFTRHARGMELTEAGRAFLDRITGLVRQIETSVDDIQSLNGVIKGHVALGIMPTISTLLSVRLVRRVKEEFPDIQLRIVEGYSVHLLEWLQRGDIDVTFQYGSSGDYHLRSEEILLEDIVLISAPNSLGDSEGKITIQEMAKLPLALPSESFGLRRVLESAGDSSGVSISPEYQIDSFWVIKSLVESGVCHSLMPISSVLSQIESGLIEARQLHPKIQRQIVLLMPNDRVNTRATDAVIDLLKKEIDEMIACGEWPAVAMH
jgi:LysR family nitrogen assimilation transcriptional regulator